MADDPSTVLERAARGPVRRVLVVMLGDSVTTHELPATGEVLLGRAQTAPIRIDHPSVSRGHVAVEIADRLRIRDVGSANGTSLRGARLPPGRAIEIGANEAFQIGEATIVIQERRIAPAPSAPRAVEPPSTGAGVPAVIVDPAMQNLYELARRVARGMINVLIVGESGTGKDVLAHAIHAASARARGPLLALNCAAVSDALFESELFGHERGAFTGAHATKRGLLESASGGTVFLDEVGELSAAAQAKLLRVIEDRMVQRVGATESHPIDVRFVAATNRDLEAGGFRSDLFFRLSGIVLEVPPLRERRAELEPLARAFVAAAASSLGRATPALTADALAALAAHPWPGNIRELRNVLDRAVLLGGDAITAADLFGSSRPAPLTDERARIVDALERCAGNQTRAAELLGMPRRTLVKRLGQYEIPRPKR